MGAQITTPLLRQIFPLPNPYAGGENVTFPNGLKIKMGYKAYIAADTTVTFAAAFSTAIISLSVTMQKTGNLTTPVTVKTVGVGSFIIQTNETPDGYYWVAIGY